MERKRAFAMLVLSLLATTLPTFLASMQSVSAQAVDNFVWVTNFGDTWVSKIDKSTGSATEIVATGARPGLHGVAVDPDFVWVTNEGTSLGLSKIDKATSSLVAVISMPSSHNFGVAVDPNFVWVTNRIANTVVKVDRITNSIVAQIPAEPNANLHGIALDPDFVWVANHNINSVSKIDKLTSSIVATISVDRPFGIAVDQAFVWATGTGGFDGRVWKIDKATSSVLAVIHVGVNPVGISADADFVWVADQDSNTVSKIDKSTDSVVTTTSVGAGPYGVALDQDFVWVASRNSNTVSKIARSTGSVVATIQDPEFRTPVMFGDGTGFAYDFFFAPQGAPTTLTLSPVVDANQVNTVHCVTAAVADQFGNPVPSVTVEFDVTGVNTASGSDTTDTNGQAEFCYTGQLFGPDTITAFADTNNNGQQDAGEPFNIATKIWTLPPSTALCSLKITEGGRITADNGDKATFGGNAQVSESGDPNGQQTYQDHGPAQPLMVKSTTVLSVVCSDQGVFKEASIFGEATIDGSGSFNYVIQMEDHGEPGTQDTYRILLSNGYDSGKHNLEGGNVQIHKN